ncbi:zinc-binding dehydrogenase [Amycolatopsis sp. BJA-103]|uniref:zinc-binding dehydrogenase n=1 Tax=Amycolatopsis sp. BJA-103 TaxID=1911175 RepID=UPI000C77149A|nr:zinc-binding dehydrogenase [Amycolatopsis sp. BJA-103]AUI57986.1 NADPH:quinone oxidoreductase [Amycolatopsis sp. BJA-103]PNE15727.1 NADPH:quinone oxidoreductase [Amycolatopsis sp. BJA-103]
MSTSMRAVELVRFGDADTAFAVRELPRPAPGPGQVLVRVLATSVNPLDLQTRRGDYRDEVALPAVLGNDVSGVVVETGPGAGDFQPGDEVWYLAPIFAGQGTYAEFHVVDQDLVARKPARLSHVEAAGLVLVGVTVWEALVERAAVRPGERVLVHGGAGGVGSIAVQVAAALGAEVVTTARARDHEFVTGLGADVAIDFSAGDYVPRVRELGGVDVVLDTVGGDTLARSPEVLADRGRVVSIVDIPEPQNLLAAWAVNATYHFVFVSPGRAKLEAIGRLVDEDKLRPVIGAVVPLDDIAQAHALLEGGSAGEGRGRPRGKIAIAVHPQEAADQ